MRTGNMIALGLSGTVSLAVLLTALGSFYTVDQGERAVLLRNGAFKAVEGPGLHFKTPFVDTAVTITVRTATVPLEKVNSYSFDQQPADIKISATFRIDPGQVDKAYSAFGSNAWDNIVSRVLEPRMRQELKVVFGRYTAADAIQKRAKLNADVFDSLQKALAGESEIVLESVQVENIDFSQQYVTSIEQRMQAEIQVQKIQQELQQQEVNAKITVVNAQAAADARVAEAKAEAQSIQLRGDAEAGAIKARGDALRDNPGLVALEATEKWNGVLPQSMVPGSAVPFLGVK